MGWPRHVAYVGEMNACRMLIERSEWRKPLSRPKLDFKGIGSESVDWTDLARDGEQERDLVNTAINLPVP
jgi:hypothetical protein